MTISIIAAMTKNRVIGKDNKLPWYIPEDLQHFKKVTMGKPIIMGRATFDSMNRRVLPGRKTIILTRSNELIVNDITIVHSIDEAITAAGDMKEIMIVGGANIYKQFLPIANKMYLSIINKDYDGDVFFPEYDERQWKIISTNIKEEFTVNVFEKNT